MRTELEAQIRALVGVEKWPVVLWCGVLAIRAVTNDFRVDITSVMFNFIRNKMYWVTAITAITASVSINEADATTYKNHFVENMIFVRDSSDTIFNFGFEIFEQNGNSLKFNVIKSCGGGPNYLGNAAEIEVDFRTEEDAIIIAELVSKSDFEVGLSMVTANPLSQRMVFDASEVNFEDVDGMTNGGAYSARLSIREIVEWVKTHGRTRTI